MIPIPSSYHYQIQNPSVHYVCDQHFPDHHYPDQYHYHRYHYNQYPPNRFPNSADIHYVKAIQPQLPPEYFEEPAMPYPVPYSSYDARYRDYPPKRPYYPYMYQRIESEHPIQNDLSDSIPPSNKSVIQVPFNGFADSDYRSSSHYLNTLFPGNNV